MSSNGPKIKKGRSNGLFSSPLYGDPMSHQTVFLLSNFVLLLHLGAWNRSQTVNRIHSSKFSRLYYLERRIPDL